MKVVIDIPDKIYEDIRWHRLQRPETSKTVAHAILKGRKLHECSQIVDASDIVSIIKKDSDKRTDSLFGDGMRYCIELIMQFCDNIV